MRASNRGFTLIELVVVIAILAALAAIALPRYINLSQDARVASVNGVAGGVRAAVAVVQARYFVNGNTAATTVTMLDGTVVNVAAVTGIPTGANTGIGNALQSGNNAQPVDGYTTAYGATTTITPNSGGSATCRVEYVAATGAVTAQTGGC